MKGSNEELRYFILERGENNILCHPILICYQNIRVIIFYIGKSSFSKYNEFTGYWLLN